MSEALIFLLVLNLQPGDRVEYRTERGFVCGTVAETRRERVLIVGGPSVAPDEVVKGCP